MPGTPSKQLHHPPLTTAAAVGAKLGTHMVARHGEREKDGIALPSRDAVPGSADALDRHSTSSPSRGRIVFNILRQLWDAGRWCPSHCL